MATLNTYDTVGSFPKSTLLRDIGEGAETSVCALTDFFKFPEPTTVTWALADDPGTSTTRILIHKTYVRSFVRNLCKDNGQQVTFTVKGADGAEAQSFTLRVYYATKPLFMLSGTTRVTHTLLQGLTYRAYLFAARECHTPMRFNVGEAPFERKRAFGISPRLRLVEYEGEVAFQRRSSIDVRHVFNAFPRFQIDTTRDIWVAGLPLLAINVDAEANAKARFWSHRDGHLRQTRSRPHTFIAKLTTAAPEGERPSEDTENAASSPGMTTLVFTIGAPS
jgi:hypothetical protein